MSEYACPPHNWIVFSTSLSDVHLRVECAKCQTTGTVDHPTFAEWKKAFYASSIPYQWTEPDRVTIRQRL